MSGTKRGYRQLLTPSCSILHEVCLSRLRKAFRAAHAKSTAAMKSGDYRALGEAIDAERKLVDEQKSLIDAHMRALRKR